MCKCYFIFRTVAAELPWGLPKVVPVIALDYGLPTGSFAGQSVLMDLFSLFERKLQTVTEEEPIVRFQFIELVFHAKKGLVFWS